jgi:hypothetical protein
MKIKSTLFMAITLVLSAGILFAGNVVGDKLTSVRENTALREELSKVIPGIGDFTVIESDEEMPDSVKTIYVSNEGTAVRLSVVGYSAGLELLCGVKDGKVTSVICVSSRETLGAEKSYGEKFSGKDHTQASITDTVSGATKTTSAYKQGVLDALKVSEKVSGKR